MSPSAALRWTAEAGNFTRVALEALCNAPTKDGLYVVCVSMTVDWTVSVSTLLLGAGQLVLLVSAYYGLKADNAALAASLALSILTEKTKRESDQVAIRHDLTSLITALDVAIKELSSRVLTLESGQDEWTKALRKRTHDIADNLNALVLKVDRLERGPK